MEGADVDYNGLSAAHPSPDRKPVETGNWASARREPAETTRSTDNSQYHSATMSAASTIVNKRKRVDEDADMGVDATLQTPI